MRFVAFRKRLIIKLRAKGDVPDLAGTSYIGTEEGKHIYHYDAGQTQVSQIFGSISRIPLVEDVELGHEAIEQVIARLYEDWKKDK